MTALVLRPLVQSWRWGTAFRRTRPFWGGVLSVAGGAWIIHAMSFELLVAVRGGWSYSAGYILGGGMVVFALVSWFAPVYKGLCGLTVFGLALLAFLAANLGGYLIGTVLGIVGGAMIWGWGEKRPRKSRR